MALTGDNFCKSTVGGLRLLKSNPMRFGVQNVAGELFAFFAKLFIISISSLIGFVIITEADTYRHHIYSPFIPTLVIICFVILKIDNYS